MSDWLDRVAALGCIICERPAVIHHIREGQGKGQRGSDKDVLPLCPEHHNMGDHGVAFHSGKKIWQETFGTERELYQLMLEKLDEQIT